VFAGCCGFGGLLVAGIAAVVSAGELAVETSGGVVVVVGFDVSGSVVVVVVATLGGVPPVGVAVAAAAAAGAALPSAIFNGDRRCSNARANRNIRRLDAFRQAGTCAGDT
jgi:hypothetical protein